MIFKFKVQKFDSAQCDTAQSQTPCSVRQFLIFKHFNFPTRCSVILRGVWLGAVSNCVESRFSRISLRKRIFQRNNFRLFIRDPNGFDSWKKSRDTASLKNALYIARLTQSLSRGSKFSMNCHIAGIAVSMRRVTACDCDDLLLCAFVVL